MEAGARGCDQIVRKNDSTKPRSAQSLRGFSFWGGYFSWGRSSSDERDRRCPVQRSIEAEHQQNAGFRLFPGFPGHHAGGRAVLRKPWAVDAADLSAAGAVRGGRARHGDSVGLRGGHPRTTRDAARRQRVHRARPFDAVVRGRLRRTRAVRNVSRYRVEPRFGHGPRDSVRLGSSARSRRGSASGTGRSAVHDAHRI